MWYLTTFLCRICLGHIDKVTVVLLCLLEAVDFNFLSVFGRIG